MQTTFIILILLLGFLITFQIAKASEYVSVMRGEEKSRKQTYKINAFLLLVFLVLGLIGVYYCNEKYGGKILQFGSAASDHGHDVDRRTRSFGSSEHCGERTTLASGLWTLAFGPGTPVLPRDDRRDPLPDE